MTVEAAGARESAAFLSDLAVRGRVAVATQKQALNAVVFILREALGRHLDEIPFTRAMQSRRVPVVLSRGECAPRELAASGRWLPHADANRRLERPTV